MMEELRRNAEELGSLESEVQEQVKQCIEAGKEIDQQVENWLKEAHDISINVKTNWPLNEKDKARLGNRFLFRNWLSKKSNTDVLETKTLISDLVARGKNILSVCFPVVPKGIELVWRDGFVEFKSRTSAFDKIMGRLKVMEIGIVGVLGMGGIGKTKLVVEIGKKFKDEKLFDEVIMATVSQTLKVRDIQGQLADMLGIGFTDETESARADKLRARLMKVKKILVVLDDVWGKVDMNHIGIPPLSDHKGCKILFTTRRKDVCDDMCCTLPVDLDVIEETEAWDLFCTYSGLKPKSSLTSKAKKVVSECAGLPLAIVTVGSALRDKSSEDYEDAAHKLSTSSFTDIESADRNVYACLKLSYDYLEDDETQKCFLLCSSFPEDRKIKVEELTRYAYGSWLFQNDQSLDQSRRKILDFIAKLEKANLLSSLHVHELGSSKEHTFYVQMHDLVRDVALWITKESGAFLVPKSLKEVKRKDIYEKASVIFLDFWDFRSQFPHELDCPNLKILIMLPVEAVTVPTFGFSGIQGQPHPAPSLVARQVLHSPRVEFTADFFEKASTLQVLDFEASSTVLLHFLVNLRTLHFRGTDLRYSDMSTIGKLRNLQILKLVFIGDSTVLPEWIGELCNLRLLDLSDWYDLEEIPPNVFSKLENLEELYTPLCHQTIWSDAFLSDLKELRHLTTFSGMLSSVHSLPQDFSFSELQRYCILCKYSVSTSKWSRALMLDGLNKVKVFQHLFPSVECLHIMGPMMDIQNMCPQIDQTGFQNLRELYLSGIPDLECLIDYTTETEQASSSLTMPEIVLPRLVHLFLSEMKQVRRMCRGPLPMDFLGALRCAWYTKCPSLENIVPDMLPVAPQLDELQVWRCESLEYVYKVEAEALQDMNHHYLPMTLLPSPTSLKLFHLPKLQKIWKVPYLLEKDERDTVEACISICEAILENIFSLIKVEINHCAELEEIFPNVALDSGTSGDQLPNLVELKLEWLPKLKSIWNGPNQNGYLYKIQNISIEGCDRLTSLFTSTLAQSLVNLQDLKVCNCYALETIITRDDQDEALSSRNVQNSTSQKGFQQIKSIYINACHKLKCVLPTAFVAEGLPKLASISIGGCPVLKHIIGDKSREEYKVESRNLVMKNLQSLRLVNVPRLVRVLPSNWRLLVSSLARFEVTTKTKVMEDGEYIISCIDEGEDQEERGGGETGAEVEPLANFYGGSIQHLRQEEHCMVFGGILPIRALQSLQDFQAVEIDKGVSNAEDIYDAKEVFDVEEAQQPVLTQLEVVKVGHMPNLKYIWKGPTKFISLQTLRKIVAFRCASIIYLFPLTVARNLPCLESLKVCYCPQLEHIFHNDMVLEQPQNSNIVEPSNEEEYVEDEICLPNLKDILVERCDNLKSLFPLSIAQHLPSLEIMCVRGASQLKQLFWEDRESRDLRYKDTIMLPKLEHIQLHGLPKISSIAPPGYVLTRMVSEDCKAEAVSVQDLKGELLLIRNCRPILKKSTTLSQLANLSHLCRMTVVESVTIVKFLFKRSMAQALCSLERLEVIDCPELETLIEPASDQEHTLLRQNHSSATCFPRLTALRIVGCDKLKNVFPLSIARCLPELKYLYLNNLRVLEEIFTDDQNEEYGRCKKLIKLPELLKLWLAQLPRLYRICPLDYAVCVPNQLEDLSIGLQLVSFMPGTRYMQRQR